MKAYLISLLAVFSVCTSHAVELKKIPFEDSLWDEASSEVVYEKFHDRDTAFTKGNLWAKDIDFRNGTIEVDIMGTNTRSFGGIIFRGAGGHYEEIYLRLHKNRQVDAVQYTPVYNHESNWQLFPKHQSRAVFDSKGWNTLKIVVDNDIAQIHLNGEYLYTIDQLQGIQESGSVGVFALFGTRFSNFRISDQTQLLEHSAKAVAATNGIVRTWKFSEPRNTTGFSLKDIDPTKLSFPHTIISNPDGLVPITKHLKKPTSGGFEQNREDFVVAKFTVHSTSKQSKFLSFDFSDKIIVYQGNKVIFKGDNSFRAKGIQYMGHVSLGTNNLLLDLEEGANDFYFVVSEVANGWGVIAEFEEMAGLEFR